MPIDVPLMLVFVSFIWLLILSYILWNMINHYNNLTKNSEGVSLHAILEKIMKEKEQEKKDIDFLRTWCDKIETQGKLHIQKIGLVRFNPFNDTGGDQSFILALVNGHDTGVVISGLYSRTGTRWYAKKIVSGKGIEHELSHEEKQALKEAVAVA